MPGRFDRRFGIAIPSAAKAAAFRAFSARLKPCPYKPQRYKSGHYKPRRCEPSPYKWLRYKSRRHKSCAYEPPRDEPRSHESRLNDILRIALSILKAVRARCSFHARALVVPFAEAAPRRAAPFDFHSAIIFVNCVNRYRESCGPGEASG